MKILRINAVLDLTGLKRSTLYRLINKEQFPKSIKLSERSIGWRESEVNKWIEDRA